jgi:hypothetical protein
MEKKKALLLHLFFAPTAAAPIGVNKRAEVSATGRIRVLHHGLFFFPIFFSSFALAHS